MPPVTPTCEQCAMYVAVSPVVGECRRYPPRFHPHATTAAIDTPTMTQTVLVSPSHFCGEWRNKV